VGSRQGTLIADVSTGARTATLVGFDPGESDWPLKASFVLFVRNLLELSRAHRAQGLAGPARTGEPLRMNVPPSATKVEVTGPGDAPLEDTLRDGLLVVPDTSRAGFYRVRWQGPQAGSALLPANLASAAESDLSHPSVVVEEGKVSVSAAPTEAHREHAWLLALLALALVVFDVWYLTRSPRSPHPLIGAKHLLPHRDREGAERAVSRDDRCLPKPPLPDGRGAGPSPSSWVRALRRGRG
jgi:hypothetical protein